MAHQEFTVAGRGVHSDGVVQMLDTPSPTRRPVTTAEFFIQWKGTDVCLDFYCPCGMQSHFDGGFAYALECQACGQVYDMPHTIGAVARP